MEDMGSLDLNSVMIDTPHNPGCVELEICRRDEERYKREMDQELDAMLDNLTDDESEDDLDDNSKYEAEKECIKNSLYSSESSVGASEVSQRSPTNCGQSVERGSYEEQSDIYNRPYTPNQGSNYEESVSHAKHHTHAKRLTANGHCDDARYENSEKSFSAYSYRNQRSAEFQPDNSFSHAYSQRDQVERSFLSDNHSLAKGDYSYLKESRPADPTSSHQHSEELQEEFLKLQILHESTCNELENVKRLELNFRKEAEQKMRTLELKQALLEDDKDKLNSNLQESQNLISDYKHENNVLLGKVNALELQLSAMIKTKDEALSKLSGYEVTISSLERQIRDLSGTESLTRLRDQQDKIFEDMKLRHQKEVLKYKEIIDELQSKLNTKILDAENWKSENAELQQRLYDLQMEKTSQFNKMAVELEKYQKHCQKLMESGNLEDISSLKLQVRRLEEDKFKSESENIALKGEINSLKAELNASETLQKLAFTGLTKNQSPDRAKELNLQNELENSLKNVRNLREEKQTLIKQLKETEKSFEIVNKNSQMFEARCIESEKKIKELEEQLSKLASDESKSRHSLEQRCKSLDEDLSKVRTKLSETTDRFNKMCQNERILSETNMRLQNNISEMIQKHSEEKIKAVEDCRGMYQEIHESTLKKEKQKIMHQTEAEKKNLCLKYENRIAEMEKEIKSLKDGLYDSKAQFLSLYKDNQDLQSQLDSISKPKEREEMEKEVNQVYEIKFNKMKEALVVQNKQLLEKHFNDELEKMQMKWTAEKMKVVEEYIENTKKQLDERFLNCLQKERDAMQQKLESEKEVLHKRYEELSNSLKEKLEEEKKLGKEEFAASEQSKELEKLMKSHELQMVSLKQMYENKITDMEKEIKHLQEMSGQFNSKTKQVERLDKLNADLIHEHDIWQKERALHKSKEMNWEDTEKKLLEKIKKYQHYVNRSEKKFKEKQATLLSQISSLEEKLNEKQKEMDLLREKFEQDMLDFGEKFKNRKKNSSCQTVEDMVPKQTLQDMQEQFFSCLRKISNGVREFAVESKKRHAKQLEASLHHYHEQMSAKSLQDLSKVARTFTPTFVVPHVSQKNVSESSSKGMIPSTPSFPAPRSVNFKTSTPDLLHSAEDLKGGSGLLKNSKYSTIVNDTRVKNLYSTNPVSDFMFSDRPSYTRVERNDGEGRGFTNTVLNYEFSNNAPSEYDSKKHKSDAPLRFEDISYDFLSMTSGLFNANNVPDYSLPEKSLMNSFPVKLPRS